MKTYVKIWTIVSALLVTACENWLDVQQEGETEAGSLFSSGEGYRAALNGIYKSMGSTALYGRELAYGMVDCMSQQYDLKDLDANRNQIYQAFQDFNYLDNGVVGVIENTWLAGFSVIANANDLIQHTSGAPDGIFEEGGIERRLILGEAYACRALLHFDLLRLFAPAPESDDGETYVPYVEEYPNIHPASIPIKPFLDKVIADLLKAKENVAGFDTIPAGIAGSKSGEARTSLAPYSNEYTYQDFFYGRLYRLSYYSITALLARVYQYAGMTEEAFACAKEVTEFGTEKDGKAFYEDDFEGILKIGGNFADDFEQGSDFKAKSNIIFSAWNKKLYDEANFQNIFNARKDNSNGGSLNSYLKVRKMELFKSRGTDESAEDIRSSKMLVLAQGNYPISGKWYLPSSKIEESEHLKMSPVIRLTEMRYIMAECHARKGEYEPAYQILNDIRSKRQLERPLAVQSSFKEFVTDLVEDARREWISEGQLLYLYKRLNAPLTVNGEPHALTKAEACLPLPSDQK